MSDTNTETRELTEAEADALDIKQFIEGRDPQERIVAIETSYTDNYAYLIVDHPQRGKIKQRAKFKPFLWIKKLDVARFYGGNARKIKKKMKEYGVKIDALRTDDNVKLEEGFKFIAHTKLAYNDLLSFFKEGGLDPFKQGTPREVENKANFLTINPAEQYLIQKQKRLFKGFDDYSDVHKMTFDIETTSLRPEDGDIFLIGVRDNRGFEEVIDASENELKAIHRFFEIIHQLKPSIIVGYNSENFDWYWFFRKCELYDFDIKRLCKTLNRSKPIYRRKGSLKLGGDVEQYEQTVMWGYNIIDTYHAVRKAMAINSELKSASLKYICKESKIAKESRVYIPGEKIGLTWKENKAFFLNEATGEYTETNGEVDFDNRIEVDGKEIVTRYLQDDLWETEQVDNSFNQASYLLSKLVPTSLQRVSTMGTAALWKLLMLSYSYEKGLAVPPLTPRRSFTGGLSRLIKSGYSKNIVKLDFDSLYPAIQLTYDIFPESDVDGGMKRLLGYSFDTRNKYKELKGKYKKSDPKLSSFYDKSQLPLKIVNNSMFGSLGAPNVFPWGDANVAELITCVGRQYLRSIIKFFIDKGFVPLVLDTDGVNFSYEDGVDDRHAYTGKGLHYSVEKDKEYVGVEAVVAEYNDHYMKKKMGLGIDGIWKSTINLKRKNYAIMEYDGSFKKTGNSIKSKAMPTYIEEFLDVGIKMLLEGQGKEFTELYYDHVNDICNMQIPLMKIASKSRVKKTIKAYKGRGVNKNGNALPRQAHMELLIKDGITPNLGDTVYYVNNGLKKSHGDIRVSKTKNDPPEGTLHYHSYRIPTEDLENNPGKTGEYNVARYLSNFNKRIEPLLVCFDDEVRESLIVTDIADRQFFTRKQCELVNGKPMVEDEQDSIEDLLTVTEQEVDYWKSVGKDPNWAFEEAKKM